MTDKEKIHQILSSLWKNDDSVGKTYYNQALQDVQTAFDLQEGLVSNDFEEAADNALNNVLNNHEIVNVRSCMEMFKYGAQWQKTKDESITEDLGEYINELSKQFPEVSFAKLSRIAVRVAKWQKERDEADRAAVYKCEWNYRKVQMMKNLWKPADGDDLPEYDREVIAIINNGKVVFAHRPDPKGWDAKSFITEKIEHYTPETYGKGGWNIPDVKYWLDVRLPKEIEI